MERTVAMVRENGWQVENVDVTIVAQQPRLTPHVSAMRKALAKAVGIAIEDVSVKATTTDGMGFTGGGQGILGVAVASLIRSPA
jgi:2-C-methyl-D-erythritol 2,4-cyclodiphosphate synthase